MSKKHRGRDSNLILWSMRMEAILQAEQLHSELYRLLELVLILDHYAMVGELGMIDVCIPIDKVIRLSELLKLSLKLSETLWLLDHLPKKDRSANVDLEI